MSRPRPPTRAVVYSRRVESRAPRPRDRRRLGGQLEGREGSYGSKLTLGFETIGIGQQYFGSRFYSRLDLTAGERLRISPMIEVTDMPHADSFRVQLLADATVDLGHGFSATVRGDYQARRSTSGGVTLGHAF